MLSFKDYRKLNESFGAVTLGLGRSSSIGVVGSQGFSLEEGKKKCKSCGKKKMDVDDDDPDLDIEDEGGVKVVGDDGDNDADDKKGKKPIVKDKEDSADEGDEKPTFFQKKKSKKKMQAEGLFGKKLGKGPAPEDLGGEQPGDDMGFGDEEEGLGDELEDLGDEEEGLGDELEDLGDEEEGLGDDEEELGDEEGDELGDEMGDEMGPPPPKKGKKPMIAGPGAGGDEPPMFMKRRSRKNMTKEQAEWWDSVEGQLGANPDERFSDGFTEIKDVVQGVRQGDAQAGDVGFAPQGKVGSWF